MTLKHSPAVFTRMGGEPGTAFFVKGPLGQVHEYRKGKLRQVLQLDVLQEICGIPAWLAALQSALLNENATMSRRRYYLNGAHADPVKDRARRAGWRHLARLISSIPQTAAFPVGRL